MSDKSREGPEFMKLAATGATAREGESSSRPSMPGQPGERRAHQKAITQGLRKFFDSVASEPVPNEFLDLLQQLDEGKKGGGA